MPIFTVKTTVLPSFSASKSSCKPSRAMVIRVASLVMNELPTVPESPVSGTVQLTVSPSPIVSSLPLSFTFSPRTISPSRSPVVTTSIANVPEEPSKMNDHWVVSTLNSFSIRALTDTLTFCLTSSSQMSFRDPRANALIETKSSILRPLPSFLTPSIIAFRTPSATAASELFLPVT